MDRASAKARLKEMFVAPRNGCLNYELKQNVEIVDDNYRGEVLYVIVPGLEDVPVKGLLDALSNEEHHGRTMFAWENAVINYIDSQTRQPRCCNPAGTFLPKELGTGNLSSESIRQAANRISEHVEAISAAAYTNNHSLYAALNLKVEAIRKADNPQEIDRALKLLIRTVVVAEASLHMGYLK